jgi:hypothetical protein
VPGAGTVPQVAQRKNASAKGGASTLSRRGGVLVAGRVEDGGVAVGRVEDGGVAIGHVGDGRRAPEERQPGGRRRVPCATGEADKRGPTVSGAREVALAACAVRHRGEQCKRARRQGWMPMCSRGD